MDEFRKQYDVNAARERLEQEVITGDRMRGARIRVYDPTLGYGRRPIRMQAVKELSPLASFFLYVYEIAWMLAVLAVFMGIVWR